MGQGETYNKRNMQQKAVATDVTTKGDETVPAYVMRQNTRKRGKKKKGDVIDYLKQRKKKKKGTYHYPRQRD
jgi:hypothetical protein